MQDKSAYLYMQTCKYRHTPTQKQVLRMHLQLCSQISACISPQGKIGGVELRDHVAGSIVEALALQHDVERLGLAGGVGCKRDSASRKEGGHNDGQDPPKAHLFSMRLARQLLLAEALNAMQNTVGVRYTLYTTS